MGHLLVEVKIRTFKCPKCIFLASTSVPFRPTTVQTPNLILIETKRITVLRIGKVKYVRQRGHFYFAPVAKSASYAFISTVKYTSRGIMLLFTKTNRLSLRASSKKTEVC
jgi:hypothetical protein